MAQYLEKESSHIIPFPGGRVDIFWDNVGSFWRRMGKGFAIGAVTSSIASYESLNILQYGASPDLSYGLLGATLSLTGAYLLARFTRKTISEIIPTLVAFTIYDEFISGLACASPIPTRR